ncbi:hypothetical protein CBR_g3926 [Chara braunii]|uniref:Cofactor assembly of complex C subunit B n=1 Tax=Chara braunii TaxID=69332 RepID=A0A388KGV5_CHABU|nr:hypothetical protein CBR_g3926 [Chara braunii]|eukprot:GBG69227.1 hypothetical protein CBR_g3926 [Chara braunii]
MLKLKYPFWSVVAGPSPERILCAVSASTRQVLYMDSESSETAGVGMGSNRAAGLQNMGAEEGTGDWKPGLPDGQKGEEEEDWFLANSGLVRSMPLVVGGVGGCLVVLNRVLSGVAPVADASSGQSRADVLSLALSATLLLTGLMWKSVQPKPPVTVRLQGVECLRMNPVLPARAYEELSWAWQLVQKSMRCGGMVVIYGGQCMMQAGTARQSESGSGEAQVVDVPALVNKPICGGVLQSGKANYFGNLPLFPGRVEFDFLPSNTQAVVVHPLGEEGLLILASDTVRGFRPIDQAWIATISEKIDSTLQDVQELQISAPKPSQ